MDRLSLSKKDSETVRRWARECEISAAQVVAWLVRNERRRRQTGPSIADCIEVETEERAVLRSRSG